MRGGWKKFFRRARSVPETVNLEASGRAVPLRVRRHPHARRIVLRIDHARDEAVLTLPNRVPLREGLAFAEERRDWLADRLARLPPRVPFTPGAVLPLRGEPHVIEHADDPGRGRAGESSCEGMPIGMTRAHNDAPLSGRAGESRRTPRATPRLGREIVRVENGTILVAGQPEHLARRLADWLKVEAKRVLAPVLREKAARLGVALGKITVRDTRTLWGSCSAAGDVSLCWRLILAPPLVADYVCAHEAAHLKIRGHGPRFWALVAELAEDMAAARAWLAREGESLQRYGGPKPVPSGPEPL